MLIENETPEMSENPEDEVKREDETPLTPEDQPSESVDNDPVEQDERSTEETVTPSEDVQPEDKEPPAESEEIVKSAEEASVESTPESPEDSTPPETEASEPVQEKKEDEKPQEEKKAEAAEPSLVVDTKDLPPLNEVLEAKISDILGGDKSVQQILAAASLSDLIHLISKYGSGENVLPFSSRVGLIKRTFDSLKYKPDFDQKLGDRFLQGLAEFNRKRVAQRKVAENQREENSKHKKQLLARLKEITSSEDPTKIQEVRAVQDEWKTVGHVLKADIEPLYREYRFLLDKFYRLREMHFELLDYDRKINLQEKERLIKEAEQLIPPEEDRENAEVWRERMDRLSEIQQQWKAAGHVPREEMDRINSEFRAVIDNFFEVRQGFMEVQDQLRAGNEEKKRAILEKMITFSTFTADRPRAWNDATRELRVLQEEWKAIGQAPYKVNSELWSKYREYCNGFFSHKSEFFKKFDEFRGENLEKKRVLVERVEELVRQGEWEKTAKELKEIQKNWKEIGPVPERHSNKLWNRFRSACDTFFENRRAHYKGLHEGEHINLEAKKALIEAVKKLDIKELGGVDAAIKRIKEIQAEWKKIGKVPYKEKDTIWEKFRSTIDQFFDGLSGKREAYREMRLKASIDSIEDSSERGGVIRGKMTRLRRKISQAQEKVDQYSNNILFIAKGKKGDPLRNQIQKEIDKEKRMILEWKKEIKALNEALRNPPKPKPEPEVEKPPATEEKAPASEETKAEEASEKPASEPEPELETPSEEKEEPTDADDASEKKEGE